VILSTVHLILFCLAAVVAVAIGVVIHERRRQRGLTEILRRIVRRRSHENADDFPF
jgi:cell division protein FtsL